MMFHRHDWTEVGRTYNSGGWERASSLGRVSSIKSGSFTSQEAYDRWMYGFTNIELRCSGCGLAKVVTAPGDVAASEPS